ncbi:Acetamidase regulatory protein [Colletotrichum tropicale]|nr:Acetamidase regulatory protein [Colletotrichum tropicale]
MVQSRPLRDRANVVCVDCHARKVKCDLQDRADKVCTNCRRLNHDCIRRDGVRKRRKGQRLAQPPRGPRTDRQHRTEGVAASSTDDALGGALGRPSLPDVPRCSSRSHTTADAAQPPMAFISPSTVMSYDAAHGEPELDPSSSRSLDTKSAILRLTQADVLPRPALLRALIDAYFEHVYPLYPVIDREDVLGPAPSTLLLQAASMVGCLMRRGPESMELCRSQYEKVKTLIHLNHEADTLVLLKSLCLMTCYSVMSTDLVTLDGPWHWLGVALRMALQMGLHHRSTHDRHTNPGCLRRIFWQLVTSDRLAASCWGRPLTLHPQKYDIPPLEVSDFPATDLHSYAFLEVVRLTETMSIIAEAGNGRTSITQEEAATLVQRLCDWLQTLPESLHLYDACGTRRPFYRPASDLHIIYFVTIILLQLLDGKGTRPSIAASSLTAASCISRLYEEIHCREETAHLIAIHGYFLMVAAVPLVCFPRQSREDEVTRDEELKVICDVLGEMRSRYGGSDLVLRKIRQLQKDTDSRGGQSSHDCRSGVPGEHATWATRSVGERLNDLFAFPPGFCPRMNMPEAEMNSTEGAGRDWLSQIEYFPDFLSENGLNLTDMLALDYNLLEMPNESSMGF